MLTIVLALPPAVAQAAGDADPQAVEVIQQMDAFLRSQERLRIVAESAVDVRLDNGMLAEQANVGTLVLQSLNRVTARTESDR